MVRRGFRSTKSAKISIQDSEQTLTVLEIGQLKKFTSTEYLRSKDLKATLQKDLITTPIRRSKRTIKVPKGYQIVQIHRDGHCLYNAIMEGMINKQLAFPSRWLMLNSWERG